MRKILFLKCIICFFLVFRVTSPALSYEFDHDHLMWTNLLKKHTYKKNDQTLLKYGTIKFLDRELLHNYLKSVEAVKLDQFKKFTSDEKLAFLVNSYNAFTVEWILMNYPVKSIKDTGTFLLSPWQKKMPGYKLLGKEFSLNYIEHDLIRKNFSDPRIHFALNCASLGCPPLKTSAFTANNLQQELSEVEHLFFKNPKNVDCNHDVCKLNKILDWYGEDFESKYGTVENYVKDRLIFYGIRKSWSKGLKIQFMDYDWNLNGL